MKIRGGFISNSSSSSFILYGFSSDVSEKVYNIVEEFLAEDPTIDRDNLFGEVVDYLDDYYGLSCLGYDQLGWDGIEIGYNLEEGSKEEFNRSLKKAEAALEEFDKDFATDFAKKAIIYSDCMQD